jgi:hypothetical protein
MLHLRLLRKVPVDCWSVGSGDAQQQWVDSLSDKVAAVAAANLDESTTAGFYSVLRCFACL